MSDGLRETLAAIGTVTRDLTEGSERILREHATATAADARSRLTRIDTGQIAEGIRYMLGTVRPPDPPPYWGPRRKARYREEMAKYGQGLTAIVTVFDVGRRTGAGKQSGNRPDNLPMWIERGTRGVGRRGRTRAARKGVQLSFGVRRMAPAPFLQPAAEADREPFLADLKALADRVIGAVR